jgi:hypothetical protein
MNEWRVFLNHETNTHMAIHGQEEMQGYTRVFGPATFADCMEWVNSRNGTRPSSNYWVFRNHSSGTLFVLWSRNNSPEYSSAYGPDTFENCVEWARRNAAYPLTASGEDSAGAIGERAAVGSSASQQHSKLEVEMKRNGNGRHVS